MSDDIREYEVEIIHEPSGVHMNFIAEFDNTEDLDDDSIWQYIMDDLSIVVNRIN